MTSSSPWRLHRTPAGDELWAYHCEGTRPGERESDTVLLTAGVHGDEYEGPVALAEFLNAIQPADLCGKLVALPITNPAAFAAGTRTNQADGANLARCFPGELGGTPTRQLAAWLFEHFARDAAYAIDLHSGGVAYLFLPLAGFYGDPTPANQSFRAAREFGLPYVWQLPVTDGVLSCELWKRGATVIGNEYLGAGQLSAEGVSAYRAGIERCLAMWGFLPPPAEVTASQPSITLTGDWQLATAEGFYRARVPLGSRVAARKVIATVVDARGITLEQFHAPHDGIVAALRSKAHIRPGDWGILVAQIQPAT